MRKNKFIKFLLVTSLLLITIFYITDVFKGWGKIKVLVHNQTSSEQTIWFEPKEKYTVTIPPGEKKIVFYPTEEISISLILHYLDEKNNPRTIMLSEYIEKHERGKVFVKMKQPGESEKIEFSIKDKIK